MYRRIDPQKVHQTLERLAQRVAERFPDSSLLEVACEAVAISEDASRRIQANRRPLVLLRILIVLLFGAIAGAFAMGALTIHQLGRIDSAVALVGALEPAIGLAFFISAFVVYLFSIERRVKSERTLAAIHELRSIAHVVDMHQLTKDPSLLLGDGPHTEHSPVRSMTDFELGRYLDYCSELVSLLSKIATLYVQDFPDPVVVAAVDEIEELTTGLSRKMWQKVILLPRFRAAAALGAGLALPAAEAWGASPGGRAPDVQGPQRGPDAGPC